MDEKLRILLCEDDEMCIRDRPVEVIFRECTNPLCTLPL